MNFARATAAVLMLGLACGCTERLPPPALNADAMLALRTFPMVPAAVDRFAPSAEATGNDRGISVRLGTFRPPASGSWAEYLGATLQQQLEGSGRYDSSSSLRIGGFIVENRSREGKSSLAARFVVKRADAVVYDKVQRVEADWSSSVVGFLAYERELGNYTAMYPKLVSNLFQDTEFRTAVAPVKTSR